MSIRVTKTVLEERVQKATKGVMEVEYSNGLTHIVNKGGNVTHFTGTKTECYDYINGVAQGIVMGSERAKAVAVSMFSKLITDRL